MIVTHGNLHTDRVKAVVHSIITFNNQSNGFGHDLRKNFFKILVSIVVVYTNYKGISKCVNKFGYQLLSY